jgi:zona occludens toxin
MAILFYEGLPRSGKSYEAMSTLVIPWLKKGREVVAYIEGLETEECQARIAEAAEIPLEQVKALLFPLTREDMRPREVQRKGKTVTIDGAWIEKTRNNALHVFDEPQIWWGNRTKATEELTAFVSEHGHRGMTILLMGQSLLDVLALWRRRVDQKFVFLKLSALGADKRYRVTVYKGQGNAEFVKVADKLNKYDEKYFGTYKSHESADIDTDTYTDSRAVFWKGAMVKYGAVATLALLWWGGWNVWKFFHPEPVKPAVQASAKPVGEGTPLYGGSAKPVAAGVQPQQAVQKPSGDARGADERYWADLSGKSRVRLAGLLLKPDRVEGVVEWVDGAAHVIERVSFQTLRESGVSITVRTASVVLSLGGWNALATSWPIEADGRVSEVKQREIRGGADASYSGSSPIAPSGLVLIDNGREKPAALSPVKDDGPPAQPRVQQGTKWSFNTGG